MTDDKYLRKLENAEDYKTRMDYLKRKHDLAENTEDRLFDVWNNKKLTYRQKMAKVSKIKADAKKRLERYQKTEKATGIVSKIRKENLKRFEEKYGVAKTQKTQRVSLEELEKGAKVEYLRGDRKLMTMETARRMAANNLKKNPKYYAGAVGRFGGVSQNPQDKSNETKVVSIRGRVHALDYATLKELKEMKGDTAPNDVVRSKINKEIALRKSGVKEKQISAQARREYKKDVKQFVEKSKQKYKVIAKLPAVGYEKAQIVESKSMSKEAAEKLARKKKKLGFYAGVVKEGAKLKDTDKDGEIGRASCRERV